MVTVPFFCPDTPPLQRNPVFLSYEDNFTKPNPFSADIVIAIDDVLEKKLAAMEAHWETERGAPLLIGGWPDEKAEETRYAIPIPYALSLLAHNDPFAEIKGLKEWPRAERPPVAGCNVGAHGRTVPPDGPRPIQAGAADRLVAPWEVVP